MASFEILPAVDMKSGQAVQLVRGVAGSERVFGDPIAAAARWQHEGAQWLHLVDLDEAFGHGSNFATAAQIIRELHINVELTGGIRDDESLRRALATGCRRVNIGTAAVENPEWAAAAIEQFGDRIAIALDVKDGKLATRGWVEAAGDLDATLARFNEAGCARYVVTDVSSDGTLTGPNLDLLRQVAISTNAKVTASGGISSLADVRAISRLADIGVDSAIIGTALYVGSFTLQEALDISAPPAL
ncbi:MAG: bifunctional 1-(5-phosphoribosyl)-5-((5-phosphoribosylamino)methylideneamino)imidazole-4-carboxamide isomerase/phosphoribosylanthranilate isomerase PriA [Propionibacteriaceae bacterium]|jgi:phosphoribosylanthranilate isomerase|nr:bifunctional 1-(5-phosphoribosyl)-5-((5-phosphoribosylamino)methylideneamino)imidazole-4-carboxamide isomerase/phosphoribosylanthranilate isomerase PriA [Propionibacteriaceae bacterium]